MYVFPLLTIKMMFLFISLFFYTVKYLLFFFISKLLFFPTFSKFLFFKITPFQIMKRIFNIHFFLKEFLLPNFLEKNWPERCKTWCSFQIEILVKIWRKNTPCGKNNTTGILFFTMDNVRNKLCLVTTYKYFN